MKTMSLAFGCAPRPRPAPWVWPPPGGAAWHLLLLVATASGCVDRLALDDRRCPCLAGWFCDLASQRCTREPPAIVPQLPGRDARPDRAATIDRGAAAARSDGQPEVGPPGQGAGDARPDRAATLTDGRPDGVAPRALFVAAQTGDDLGGDGSRAAPWRTIGHALQRRTNEPELVVLEGTYRECLVLQQSHLGLTLRGAGAGTTVLDGTGCTHTVRVRTGVDRTLVLTGFTIRNGSGIDLCGGGVLIEEDASPIVEGNVVRENYARNGGGICVGTRSTALIRNNQLLANQSRYGGAGIYLDEESTALVEGNLIGENVNSEYQGGGVSCTRCQAIVRNNTIRGNRTGASSYGHGGGLSVDQGAPTVHNNLIVGNSATAYYAGNNPGGYGGGIYVGGFISAAKPTITNNTIVDNAADFGGGVALGTADGFFHDAAGTLQGNILAANRRGAGGAGGEALYVGNSKSNSALVDYNLYWANAGGSYGGWAQTHAQIGTHNLETDPRFVTGPLGGYYLSQTAAGQAHQSPAVDAGHAPATVLGLAAAHTRVDGVADSFVVDLGFHYGLP